MPLSKDSLKALAEDFGVVLLFHGTFDSSPSMLGNDFHNIAPEKLFKQLESMTRWFRFVSIDEYCAASDRSGLAAVTLDDGYRSVLEQGLKVFEALDIPVALFLNKVFLEGKPFWRDKVRLMITRNWVSAFERQFKGRFHVRADQSFYRYTKDPRNNSVAVEQALDEFLEDRASEADYSAFYLQGATMLKAHPLVSYGSHSVNHYVMSSLTEEQQWREIEENRRFLNTFKNLQQTDVFSIPFGGERDYNDATVRLAGEAGHGSLLLSRGAIQRGIHLGDTVPQSVDRIMPRADSVQGLEALLISKTAV
jgi:peptidoglycan/xylan/chitin deacetylase (PgdA/CDA1 family)